MKLLLDANLSWRLIKKLEPIFSEVFHAEQVGLSDPAPDIEIWNWALKSNATITTNDIDFYYLMLQKDFPPKVILLRTGNLSTGKIAHTGQTKSRFCNMSFKIEDRLKSADIF